jgi:hypothetical protein
VDANRRIAYVRDERNHTTDPSDVRPRAPRADRENVHDRPIRRRPDRVSAGRPVGPGVRHKRRLCRDLPSAVRIAVAACRFAMALASIARSRGGQRRRPLGRAGGSTKRR